MNQCYTWTGRVVAVTGAAVWVAVCVNTTLSSETDGDRFLAMLDRGELANGEQYGVFEPCYKDKEYKTMF